DLAVGQHRRAHAVTAIALAPELLAGGGLETEKLSDVVTDVEPAVVNDRGREFCLDAELFPYQRRLAILHLGRVKADDPSGQVAMGVFVAVPNVDASSVDDWRAIARAAAERVAPAFPPGVDLECVDAAIATAANE